MTWRDRKVVGMLATVPTSEADSDEVESSVKVPGQRQMENFARPSVINLYNTFMVWMSLIKECQHILDP